MLELQNTDYPICECCGSMIPRDRPYCPSCGEPIPILPPTPIDMDDAFDEMLHDEIVDYPRQMFPERVEIDPNPYNHYDKHVTYKWSNSANSDSDSIGIVTNLGNTANISQVQSFFTAPNGYYIVVSGTPIEEYYIDKELKKRGYYRD